MCFSQTTGYSWALRLRTHVMREYLQVDAGVVGELREQAVVSL